MTAQKPTAPESGEHWSTLGKRMEKLEQEMANLVLYFREQYDYLTYGEKITGPQPELTKLLSP